MERWLESCFLERFIRSTVRAKRQKGSNMLYHKSRNFGCSSAPVSMDNRSPKAGHATRLPNMLSGDRMLCVLDVENLSISAESRGHVIDYSRLAELLRSSCAEAHLHAFATIEGTHGKFVEQIEGAGWVMHSRPVERIRRLGRPEEIRNSDATLLMTTGFLLAKLQIDTLLIGSGDAALVIECSRTTQELSPTHRHTGTLSVSGSTGSSIDAENRDGIDFNAFIGHDMFCRA